MLVDFDLEIQCEEFEEEYLEYISLLNEEN